MKERGILFSGPMVCAILDGRKTQTRRVVTFSKPFEHSSAWPCVYPFPNGPGWIWTDSPVSEAGLKRMAVGREGKTCPCGVPGDRLWVRETWRTINDPATCIGDALDIDYRADGKNRIGDINGHLKWKPSIFMPKWASRITLEIVSVRVERVQDISEEDAVAEGVRAAETFKETEPGRLKLMSCAWAYQNLWDSINAKRGFGWDKNPWVWVIEFKRV